jgi:hypothetical protein
MCTHMNVLVRLNLFKLRRELPSAVCLSNPHQTQTKPEGGPKHSLQCRRQHSLLCRQRLLQCRRQHSQCLSEVLLRACVVSDRSACQSQVQLHAHLFVFVSPYTFSNPRHTKTIIIATHHHQHNHHHTQHVSHMDDTCVLSRGSWVAG